MNEEENNEQDEILVTAQSDEYCDACQCDPCDCNWGNDQ
mgnify:CR=1 FL=1